MHKFVCLAICLSVVTYVMVQDDPCASTCDTDCDGQITYCIDIPNLVDCAANKATCVQDCTHECTCIADCSTSCQADLDKCKGAAADTLAAVACDQQLNTCLYVCDSDCQQKEAQEIQGQALSSLTG